MSSLVESSPQEFLDGIASHQGMEPTSKWKENHHRRFFELGLPSSHHEVYRYVLLRKLYAKRFRPAKQAAISLEAVQPFVLPECRSSFLTLVNGWFVPELSVFQKTCDKLIAYPLQEAARKYSALFGLAALKDINREEDPFASLNGALHPAGLFLYFPPGFCAKAPLQVINLIVNDEDLLSMQPRVEIYGGQGSDFRVIMHTVSTDSHCFFSNQHVKIALDEAARAKLTKITIGNPATSWILSSERIALKRDSSLFTLSLTDGAETHREDVRVELKGENGEASLNGLWMLKGKREAHTNVFIRHKAPHCRSNQHFKGALADVSRSSFEGKIYVEQEAQKTNAFQLNNNLVISDHAQAFSKPHLEIFADDVKASHGATIGQLDSALLFYLQSRGVSAKEAKQMLLQGYFSEMAALIEERSIREMIEKKLMVFDAASSG